MEILFRRANERQSFAVVRRDDRVSLRVPGYGPALPLPHDLAHYVVERELRLWQGFWASVAEGCVFPGMQHLAGRRRPHAEEHSRALLRANSSYITHAEVVVGALLAIVERTLDRDPQRGLSVLAAAQSVCVVGAYPLDAAGLRNVCAELCAMTDRWQEVSIGGTLAVTWPTAAGRRHLHRSILEKRGRRDHVQARERRHTLVAGR